MTIDLVFGVVAVVVVVIVFSARGRQQKGTTTSRGHVLQTISPIVAGTLSDEMQLAGTYRGHPVEGSLRTTGRVDTIGASHFSANIEVLLLVVHGVTVKD